VAREGRFAAPAVYADARTPARAPADVLRLVPPYAAREAGANFWILSLDARRSASAAPRAAAGRLLRRDRTTRTRCAAPVTRPRTSR
jgi:hypothetical protein